MAADPQRRRSCAPRRRARRAWRTRSRSSPPPRASCSHSAQRRTRRVERRAPRGRSRRARGPPRARGGSPRAAGPDGGERAPRPAAARGQSVVVGLGRHGRADAPVAQHRDLDRHASVVTPRPAAPVELALPPRRRPAPRRENGERPLGEPASVGQPHLVGVLVEREDLGAVRARRRVVELVARGRRVGAARQHGGVDAELAEPRRAASAAQIARRHDGRVLAERRGERRRAAPGTATPARRACAAASPRWPARAPTPGLAHERLREHVVQAEAGRVERVAAEQRAEAERVAVGLAARGNAPGDQPRGLAARRGRRPGCRAARTAPRPRARARSARSRPAPSTGCDADSAGSLTTTEGRTRGVAGSTPRGVPVPAGHLRARQRRRDRHRARTPPGGGQRLGHVDHPPAAERHEPVAARPRRAGRRRASSTSPCPTWCTCAAAIATCGARLRRPLGGQQREARPAEQVHGLVDRPAAEADQAVTVAPGEASVNRSCDSSAPSSYHENA